MPAEPDGIANEQFDGSWTSMSDEWKPVVYAFDGMAFFTEEYARKLEEANVSEPFIQKPSVGRMVHYVSLGTPVRPDGTQEFTSECRAAIITGVHNETSVSLQVVNPTGVFFHNQCVLDGSTQNRRGGTWHWPERV